MPAPRLAISLCFVLAACGGGGSDSDTDAGAAGGAGGGSGEGGAGGGPGGDGIAFVGEEAPRTLAQAASYDGMVRVAGLPDFSAANLGDPNDYATTMATSPTHPDELASLYFETEALNADVQAVEDLRTGIMPVAGIGASVAQDFVQDLTLGAAAGGPVDARGGARFMAWHAVRTLDTFLLLRAIQGWQEHSAAGFDRALGLLWDADGAPQGLGRRLAEADAACGTHVLADLRDLVAGVRGPFATALTEKGQLDPLDRLIIRVGDSPEFDAFVPQAERLLHEGLALAFLALLVETPLTSLDQAQALGAYTALSAKVAAQDPDGDAYIGQQLDQADAAAIDVAGTPGMPGIRGILTAVFGVACGP